MKKILIVEDELAYVKLLRDQFTAQGYQTIEAYDGKTGLELAKAEKPDVILLDIRMPVMDGMTMLDLLRKDADGKSTKVIMLTNLQPDDKILGKVVEDLPTYYFVKSDIKFEELSDKVKELLAESVK